MRAKNKKIKKNNVVHSKENTYFFIKKILRIRLVTKYGDDSSCKVAYVMKESVELSVNKNFF